MQAVVDFHWCKQWLTFSIGWPGKVHNTRVLVTSSFYRKVITGSLVPDWSKTFGGVRVPLLVLGDSAYPLLPWLMKPYIKTLKSTDAERKYNYRQSRARMVVKNTFGCWKGQWRCLSKRIDLHVINVPCIVAACVTRATQRMWNCWWPLLSWMDSCRQYYSSTVKPYSHCLTKFRPSIFCP